MTVIPHAQRPNVQQVASTNPGVVIEGSNAYGRKGFRVTIPATTKVTIAVRMAGAEDPPSLMAWTEPGVERLTTAAGIDPNLVDPLELVAKLDALRNGQAQGGEVDLHVRGPAREFDGVVASGQEARRVRAIIGPDMAIVTPGVRLASDAPGDQARIATPAAAIADGADYLVVGRPITKAVNPEAATEAFLSAVTDALRSAAPR